MELRAPHLKLLLDAGTRDVHVGRRSWYIQRFVCTRSGGSSMRLNIMLKYYRHESLGNQRVYTGLLHVFSSNVPLPGR